MNDENSEHVADAMLRATVDEVFGSESASEAVNVLGRLAGGIDAAFMNLVFNAPEEAVRLTLFKILKDSHLDGEDEFVMEVMEVMSRATLMVEPDALEKHKQEYREDFDKNFGL